MRSRPLSSPAPRLPVISKGLGTSCQYDSSPRRALEGGPETPRKFLQTGCGAAATFTLEDGLAIAGGSEEGFGGGGGGDGGGAGEVAADVKRGLAVDERFALGER